MQHVVWRLMCRLRSSWRCDTPQGLKLRVPVFGRHLKLNDRGSWHCQPSGSCNFRLPFHVAIRYCVRFEFSQDGTVVDPTSSCACLPNVQSVFKWYLRSPMQTACVRGTHARLRLLPFMTVGRAHGFGKCLVAGAAGRSDGIRFCGRFVHHSKP